MAKNLTQATLITAAEPDDLVYLVRPTDSDATADKQITVGNFSGFGRAYGQLYIDLGLNPTMAVTTSPQGITDFDQTGLAVGMTPDLVTGRITVDTGTPDGLARVSFSVSLSNITANESINVAVFKNGGVTALAAVIDATNNNIDAGSASGGGTDVYIAGDYWQFGIWATGNCSVTFASIVLDVSAT